MKKTMIVSLVSLLFTSCNTYYTHQFKLQNNTEDTLWVNFIEQSSTFRNNFPDTIRSFQLVPSIVPRNIYTITEEGKRTAPDTYTDRIYALGKLEIAKIRTIFPDTTGIGVKDTTDFVRSDFLRREFWEYFIDRNQDAGVYLFKIDNSDLE